MRFHEITGMLCGASGGVKQQGRGSIDLLDHRVVEHVVADVGSDLLLGHGDEDDLRRLHSCHCAGA